MHALWKGALSFGLVHIPIRLYTGSTSKEIKFKLLHKKDLSEIHYARICAADGKEVPWGDIVKGYKYENDHYVIMTEEDFQKANLKKTKTIEILDFTEEAEIDTIYYDTPYFIEPEKGAANAYGLLYEALKRTGKVAIGRFVFHNREHIGVIRPYKNILILHQMRFHNEIKSLKELTIEKQKAPAKTELSMAIKLIEELSKPFHPENYSDTYIEELKDIIKKKEKGEKISAKNGKERSLKTHNILALLRESLKEKKHKKRKAA